MLFVRSNCSGEPGGAILLILHFARTISHPVQRVKGRPVSKSAEAAESLRSIAQFPACPRFLLHLLKRKSWAMRPVLRVVLMYSKTCSGSGFLSLLKRNTHAQQAPFCSVYFLYIGPVFARIV